MNSIIIDEFKRLIDDKKKQISYYTNLDELDKAKEANIKHKNFIKILQIIKQYPNEIKTENDINDFSKTKGIGDGTITRIREILTNGFLSEIKQSENELKSVKPQIEKMEDLERITGIGPTKSKKLYQQNITLKDLLKEYKKYHDKIQDSKILKDFTHHQLIGLKYFDKFEERISHQEIKSLEILFQNYLNEFNPNLESTICGSYRRQEPTSGDIDILITNKVNYKYDESSTLSNLVSFLHQKQFLIDDLTTSGTTKYMGVCIGSRRIDIRLIPRESYPASILYFTGSKDFNTRVRRKALKEGMTLEEYGLYKLKKVPLETIDENGEDNNDDKKTKYKNVKGDMIPVSSEEDILEKIGIPYLPPEKRKY